MDYTCLTDAELVNLLKAGDSAAFIEIYERYKHKLSLHAYRMLQDKEDAKDIVQEVFANIWAKKNTLNISSSVDAYLYTAMRNKVCHFFAHKKVVINHSSSLIRQPEKRSLPHDVKIIEKELLDMFERELAMLPEKMRKVFELSRQEDLSYKQIADVLKISDKTVKKQIHNATKILRLKTKLDLS